MNMLVPNQCNAHRLSPYFIHSGENTWVQELPRLLISPGSTHCTLLNWSIKKLKCTNLRNLSRPPCERDDCSWMNTWKSHTEDFLFVSGSEVSCCHHWHSQPTDLLITWEMGALVLSLACDNFHCLVGNSETAGHNRQITPLTHLLSKHIYNKDVNILIVRT